MSEVPNELKSVETALAGLAPEAGRLNRDRLLYEAGRAAAPRRVGWPVATMAMAGLAAVLTLQLATRPAPEVRTIEVVRYVGLSEPGIISMQPNQTIPEASSGPSTNGYLFLRNRVLRAGLDVLPTSPAIADRGMPAETIERGIDRASRRG